MSSSDVRFVVEKVLQPLRFPDPYSDDYYCLQLRMKKNSESREKAIKEHLPMPPMIMVPQPIWGDFKGRILQQLHESRMKVENRSRKWEQEQQVLGHMVRSQVHKPKEQLSVPSFSELSSMEDTAEDSGEDHEGNDGETAEGGARRGKPRSGSVVKMPYNSRLWSMRQAVQRGYEALYTVQVSERRGGGVVIFEYCFVSVAGSCFFSSSSCHRG